MQLNFFVPQFFLHGNYKIQVRHRHHHHELISTIGSMYQQANDFQQLAVHSSNPVNRYIDYLSKNTSLKLSVGKMK